MMNRGKFITFEGGDYAGKSTQASLLEQYLTRQNISIVRTHEPGGTAIGEHIRKLALNEESLDGITETLLMFAARREHFINKIEPALAAGKWVICDRFTDSTIAYQGGGRGVKSEFIDFLADYVVGEVAIDLTFYLQSPPATSSNPLFAAEKFERESESFYQRVINRYEKLAQQYPERIKLIPVYDKKKQRTRESIGEQIEEITRRCLLESPL